MGFEFKREDDFHNLHPNIASYMERFVNHRLDAFERFSHSVAIKDFKSIRDYCHGQLGVAGSYRCFQLEELILYIQDFARNEDITPIEEVLPIFKAYLENLKTKV